jgi:hypothetical protein
MNKILRWSPVLMSMALAPWVAAVDQEKTTAVTTTPKPYVPKRIPTIDWTQLNHVVTGEVEDTAAGSIQIKTKPGSSLLVPLDRHTSLTKEGQTVKAQDLQKGDMVTARHDPGNAP